MHMITALYLPQGLKNLDYSLFARMNGRWHSPFFDLFFPFIREPFVWLPLYVFLAVFTSINFRWRGFAWTVFLAATVGISNYLSSNVIKNTFERLRPCHEPAVAGTLRFLVSYCPESSSFTSSHACNHFAMAMFIFTTFNRAVSAKWALIFIWAFLISYAQVYVGVHFPFDVVCGALVGIGIGYALSVIFNTKIGLVPPMK